MPFLLPLADAGTPLMWATAFHLFLGNLFIGIGEGCLIAWLFKVRPHRAILWMTPANYFSMIVGAVLFSSPLAENFGDWFLGDVPLYRIRWLLFLAVLGSYVLSIFLEWPFVAAAMWKTRHGAVRALLASITAQTASYLVLVLLYSGVASLSLVTQPTLTAARDLIRTPSACVYFIGPEDRHVYRLPLDGSPRQIVRPTLNADPSQELALLPSADGSALDLCLTASDKPDVILLSGAAPLPGGPRDPETGTIRSRAGPAVDLRPPTERDWSVDTRFWPGGLVASNSATNQQIRLALETPFASWPSEYATVLPGDQVIYEVGGQIVLLDLPTLRMAFLARGDSPVVVLAPPPASPAATREAPQTRQ